ncbi:hypothetical protein CCS01_27865 [Rhodopila globiformis]|uniref:Uncharacterized protein n=2 Tax=Rhodopila globiformis TaxID=1071 RepID=A0A2S6MYD1_RHOGL|nr:hypothetical protein CCS01_27865 [Rhodopila globiformis]
MKKASLLKATCAAAMLAAAPALAQTSTGTANNYGTNGQWAAPATQNATTGSYANEIGGQRYDNASQSYNVPRGLSTCYNAIHDRSLFDNSAGNGPVCGDAAVHRLNQRSYEAAQQGENFRAILRGNG